MDYLKAYYPKKLGYSINPVSRVQEEVSITIRQLAAMRLTNRGGLQQGTLGSRFRQLSLSR